MKFTNSIITLIFLITLLNPNKVFSQCNIEDINVQFIECSTNNIPSYSLDFTPINMTSSHFYFWANDSYYSFNQFSSLPITFTVAPNGLDVTIISICDNDNSDCCIEYTFENTICEPTPGCDIQITEFSQNYCFNGLYSIQLQVEGEHPDSEGFNLVGHGPFYSGELTAYGYYNQDNHTLSSFYGAIDQTYQLEIIDGADFYCRDTIEFNFLCEENSDCSLGISTLEVQDCNENGQFYINFEVDITNLDHSEFTAFVNREYRGTFYYFEQSSYTVGPFDGDSNIPYELLLINSGAPCSASTTFIGPNCTSTTDCNIQILEATQIECFDGGYYIQFQVSGDHPDSEGFNVVGNGQVYGEFFYGQDSYIVGPFDGSNGQGYELGIVDWETEDCNDFIEFNYFCDPLDCIMSIPVFEFHECNDEGQYFIDFELTTTNAISAEFTVIGNGQNYGSFPYGETFYTVGPFDGNAGAVYELIAFDPQNDACNVEIEFESQNCEQTLDCNIQILEATQIECFDGSYYIQFQVSGDHPDSEGFNVFGNGQIYGEFFYGQDSYIAGPFNGENEQSYELIISDWGTEGCTNFIEFNYYCAPEDDCNIQVLNIETTPCENGQFFVMILVGFDNMSSDQVVVTGNDGTNYGTFPISDEPYLLGPFEGDGETVYEFIFSDSENTNCNIGVDGIQAPNCNEDECAISDLTIATGECNDQGTYALILDFNYQNANNDFFEIIYNGETIAFNLLENLPFIIEGFNGINDEETITICINDNPDCCETVTFLTPNCEDLIPVWPGDANSDNISNNFDILNIGIAFGTEGPARTNMTDEWIELLVEEWTQSFESNVNYAHTDTDGNGEINANDVLVTDQNYDLLHGDVAPYIELEAEEDSPPLFVDMPESSEIQQGIEFVAPIIFGSEEFPVEAAYGLAFTLKFDPEIINPESISIATPNSWLGANEVNLISFNKKSTTLGEIDIAITKIDQNNTTGWGEILHFIGIIDNIAGLAKVSIEVLDVKAITREEVAFPVKKPLEIIQITHTDNLIQLNGFDIYPNPSNGEITIKNETGLYLYNTEIIDLNGKTLISESNSTRLNLSHLPSGVYIIRCDLETTILTTRLVLIK